MDSSVAQAHEVAPLPDLEVEGLPWTSMRIPVSPRRVKVTSTAISGESSTVKFFGPRMLVVPVAPFMSTVRRVPAVSLNSLSNCCEL